ncbi:hypothetical protein [Desulfosarcina cetonica]|uniref:hypothetical protein n=1 Tax=Desulfosarcina cetonica TaxID=90730 RepID=UPI0012EDA6C5|nr:hypothetical protein [Desulfosarcina cetonica]
MLPARFVLRWHGTSAYYLVNTVFFAFLGAAGILFHLAHNLLINKPFLDSRTGGDAGRVLTIDEKGRDAHHSAITLKSPDGCSAIKLINIREENHEKEVCFAHRIVAAVFGCGCTGIY